MWHSSSDMAQVNTDMAHLEPANIQDTVASGVFDPPTHHATIEFSNFYHYLVLSLICTDFTK